MALSNQEKADIVFQLGWPGLSIVEGSTDFNKILVNRLTNTSTAMDAQARSLLTRIASIDTKLQSATSRMLAKKIGDIELRDGESALLASEKKRLIRELADLLGIKIMRSGGVNISVCN